MMNAVRHMKLLVHSLFFSLSYVTPAYGEIIFHESIQLAPAIERNVIYAARASIAETASINDEYDEWDGSLYLEDLARDLVGSPANIATLYSKSL